MNGVVLTTLRSEMAVQKNLLSLASSVVISFLLPLYQHRAKYGSGRVDTLNMATKIMMDILFHRFVSYRTLWSITKKGFHLEYSAHDWNSTSTEIYRGGD